jgi:hypothetical protein
MKNNRKIISLILKSFLIFLLFGCASTKKGETGLPEWVKNPNSKYHNALYIVAVGSGSSREVAKRDAIASLSNIFSVDVSFDRRIIEAYAETRKGRDIDVTHSINLLTESALKSENKLINVREGDTFFDDKTGTFYVLVFINRTETEPLYLDEIKKNDNIIEEYYYLAEETESKLERFIYLKKAQQVAFLNEGLRKMYRIISNIGDAPVAVVPTQKLNTEIYELSKKIVANIKVAGEFNEEFASFLREVIQETGFMIGRDNVDLTIKANLKIDPLDLPREEVFVMWKVIIDVHNAISGTIMETFTKEGREGHMSLEAARNSALGTVREILKNDFYIEFNKFLNKSLGE